MPQDMARGVPTRLTFSVTAAPHPVWSPDGSRIMFNSNHRLYVKPSNGAGMEELGGVNAAGVFISTDGGAHWVTAAGIPSGNYSIHSVAVDPATSVQSSGQFPEPIVRQFKSELSLTLRDGQTEESLFATDPLSGKVFKAQVSLNIVK